MALLIDTISENKSVFNPSSELKASNYGVWDLTKSSITFNGVNPKIKNVIVVTEFFQMRPDLLAMLNLGDQGKMGTLLKFNSISNPFAIQQGQVMMIPTEDTVTEIFRAKKLKEQTAPNSNTNTNPNQTFKNNQEQKKFKVSDGRKKFLEEKVKNKPAMILPPNVTQPNERPLIKKDGYFIFAPDAGGGGLNSPQNS